MTLWVVSQAGGVGGMAQKKEGNQRIYNCIIHQYIFDSTVTHLEESGQSGVQEYTGLHFLSGAGKEKDYARGCELEISQAHTHTTTQGTAQLHVHICKLGKDK